MPWNSVMDIGASRGRTSDPGGAGCAAAPRISRAAARKPMIGRTRSRMGNAPSALALLRVDERAQNGVHAGLVARATVTEPGQNVLVDPQGDRLLRLRPGDLQVGPVLSLRPSGR